MVDVATAMHKSHKYALTFTIYSYSYDRKLTNDDKGTNVGCDDVSLIVQGIAETVVVVEPHFLCRGNVNGTTRMKRREREGRRGEEG